MSDYIDQFRQAIEAAGLPAPAEIINDGNWHRFSTNGKRGKKSGWYILHGDGIPAGSFGCWSSDLKSTWSAKSYPDMSTRERQANRDRIESMRRQREAEELQLNDEAAAKAAAMWQAAQPADESHSYIRRKGIKPHATKINPDGWLLVPMRDTSGKLWNVERIAPEKVEEGPDKKGLYGGRRKALYFGIGKPEGILIICEGFATGASIHECTGHAVAVAFNAGNLEPVAMALREKYPTLAITIAADDDHLTEGNPGLTKATAAALAVRGTVAVPVFPADRPANATDFNDLYQVADSEAVRRCIKGAQAPGADTWPVPESLFASYAPLPYPVDALPHTIRDAVMEVIGFVKAPIVLAAASALSAVSAALQGQYDVERAPGLKGPCSLYGLSVADSGERKSSCDGYFKQALDSWQRDEVEILKPMIAVYEANKAAWDAKKSGILEAIKKAAKGGKTTDRLEQDLRNIEQEKPIPVRVPRLVRGDDTPENLGWSLTRDYPSAVVQSSEAGVVFGSHGMGSDSVIRNLALLNVLWDGGSIPVGRRSSESYTIEGVRLTMGLQVQELTLRTFFEKSKGLARGTGFLARFLIAWPESTMGTRLYTKAPDWTRLQAFNHRIRQLLQNGLNIDDDGRLITVTLSLSEQAHAAWVTFQNAIELQLAPDGELQDVKDVASKVADNAARLAALFHVFEHGTGAISADAMARGAKLAAWHLSEARRFLGQFAIPVEWMNAARVERWLIQHCRREGVNSVSTKTAMQYGPLRDKATLQAALTHLEDHGRARMAAAGRRRLIDVNPALLKVMP